MSPKPCRKPPRPRTRRIAAALLAGSFALVLVLGTTPAAAAADGGPSLVTVFDTVWQILGFDSTDDGEHVPVIDPLGLGSGVESGDDQEHVPVIDPLGLTATSGDDDDRGSGQDPNG